MDMSDNQLAALAAQGDAEAFRRLFERYQHPIYNFVYRMVDNAEDASDIVQNAFIKVYGALGEKEIDNFSAYLYRTARNLAYDEIRRRRRFVDVDHEVLVPEDPNIYADPQRALMLGEQIGAVRAAVAHLSENHRAALILRELQDLDYDQMSEVLDSNRNAVGAMLSRARLRLREELRMAQIQTNRIPPDCEEIIALLSPYIDRELRPEEVERVESHLDGCTFCSAALEEMQEASRSFRAFIPVVPPPDIAQAVSGRIDSLARSGESAWPPDQGLSEGPAATAGSSGRSRFARALRSPLVWGSLAGLILFAGAALLLAERAGWEGSPVLTGTGEQTETRTDNTDTGADTTGQTTDSNAAPADSGSQSTEIETVPGPGFGLVGGYMTPNPAYPGGSVSFYFDVTGRASSVTVSLVSGGSGQTVASYGLELSFSDAGQEQWYGSGGAGKSGEYEVYVFATGADGSETSLYLGTLAVQGAATP